MKSFKKVLAWQPYKRFIFKYFFVYFMQSSALSFIVNANVGGFVGDSENL